jgi:hypothetical protein
MILHAFTNALCSLAPSIYVCTPTDIRTLSYFSLLTLKVKPAFAWPHVCTALYIGAHGIIFFRQPRCASTAEYPGLENKAALL